jgi:hypothetical protein
MNVDAELEPVIVTTTCMGLLKSIHDCPEGGVDGDVK